MSSYLSAKGYDTLDLKILSKDGQEVDEEFLKRYRCVKCKFLLRKANQLSCGDRICKDCLPYSVFKCPSCDEEIDPSQPQQYFNDRSCQKDIQELIVVCKCGKEFPVEVWEGHSDSCPELVKEKKASASSGDVIASEEIKKLAGDLQQTKSTLADIKRQTARTARKTEAMERDIRELKVVVDEIRGQTPSSRMLSGASPKPLASGDMEPSESRGQVRKLNEKYTQLNEIVTQLVADVEQHKGTLTQMHSTVDHVSQTIPRFESILEELNLKIEILEVKSQTGNFVWKVNEVGRRQREARIGRTVSLYSPPFYTSVHGYRICLRAYLNGDGSGRDSHVSLFVVLMKSEYDDLLSWPFRHKVTLRLINQDYPLNPERGISHKFVPNTDSSSFQKPVESFNVASGFPEFAPQSVLEDQKYVRNDTMYFQVITEAPPDLLVTGPDHTVENRDRHS